MEKLISEMAKVICHAPTCEIRKNGGTCYKNCKAYIYAFRAINTGYRKSSDIAREIFKEIEDVLNNIGYFDAIDYNELKKKYTESENTE